MTYLLRQPQPNHLTLLKMVILNYPYLINPATPPNTNNPIQLYWWIVQISIILLSPHPPANNPLMAQWVQCLPITPMLHNYQSLHPMHLLLNNSNNHNHPHNSCPPLFPNKILTPLNNNIKDPIPAPIPKAYPLNLTIYNSNTLINCINNNTNNTNFKINPAHSNSKPHHRKLSIHHNNSITNNNSSNNSFTRHAHQLTNPPRFLVNLVNITTSTTNNRTNLAICSIAHRMKWNPIMMSCH